MGQRVDTRTGSAADDSQYTTASGGIITTSNTILIPAVAGMRAVLTSLNLKNVSAVASEVVIRDGAGSGTIIARWYLPASMLNADPLEFKTPYKSSPGNAISMNMITTATQTYVMATGYYKPDV